MLSKKVVGITSSKGYLQKSARYRSSISYINNNILELIYSFSSTPIILYPVQSLEEIALLANCIDVLILSGGEDIHPQFYSEKINYDYYKYNLCNPVLERDFFEISLYKIIKQQGKPILGICRGMQIINIAEGGSLCQNIISDIEHSVREDSWIPYHPIKLVNGTQIHKLLGVDSYNVSSSHHQCIKELGNNLNVSAIAEDNIIEAIEAKDQNLQILGFQGHIENIILNYRLYNKIFKYILQ